MTSGLLRPQLAGRPREAWELPRVAPLVNKGWGQTQPRRSLTRDLGWDSRPPEVSPQARSSSSGTCWWSWVEEDKLGGGGRCPFSLVPVPEQVPVTAQPARAFLLPSCFYLWLCLWPPHCHSPFFFPASASCSCHTGDKAVGSFVLSISNLESLKAR